MIMEDGIDFEVDPVLGSNSEFCHLLVIYSVYYSVK